MRDNNISRVGTYSKNEPLMLVIRDESHRKIAGLYGYQSLGVFFLDLLWVDPAYRSKGLGEQLLKTAEEYATEHQALYMRVETASFQAPNFYKKQGYEVFAKLPLLIEGEEQHYNYYLIKYLNTCSKNTMKQEILITEYNPKWPLIFEREKEKILSKIGQYINAIEHIGSTSVVGLAAKPVIDVAATVESFDITPELIEPLRNIGYEYVPEYEKQLPNRRFFHRGPSETTGAANRHFHLHIAEEGSSFWKEHILFRDCLRRNPDLAHQYEALKKQLATASHGDINIYCSGKDEFIKRVIQKAMLDES